MKNNKPFKKWWARIVQKSQDFLLTVSFIIHCEIVSNQLLIKPKTGIVDSRLRLIILLLSPIKTSSNTLSLLCFDNMLRWYIMRLSTLRVNLFKILLEHLTLVHAQLSAFGSYFQVKQKFILQWGSTNIANADLAIVWFNKMHFFNVGTYIVNDLKFKVRFKRQSFHVSSRL